MDSLKKNFVSDFLASIVVFLVALPLCMGIAIASGVPPAAGLIAGIIGGLVVGALSGAPLQVSGPAAGLAVMVYEFVQVYGVGALIPLGILVGLTQILAAYLRFGLYFKATSPSLIKGLLAGIGVLIFSSQFHIMLDDTTKSSGLQNLFTIPQAFENVFMDLSTGIIHYPAIIGLATISTIIFWNELRLKITRIIPAPLLAVLVGTFLATHYKFPVKLVDIPDNLFASFSFGGIADSFSIVNLKFIGSAIGMAFVASAETLLCVTAVDKMTKGASNYNKEMFAQGVGNMIAGLFGALPLTGVIVRSSANVESGGQTRNSAIMHGIWLLLLVLIFPQILGYIPMSALAAILVFTGWKLMNLSSIPGLWSKSRTEFLIYVVTVATIVSVDLLTGVIAGFLVSLFVLVFQLLKLDIKFAVDGKSHTISFTGRVSFLNLPDLSKQLDEYKPEENTKIVVDLEDVEYIDHAIEEHLDHWSDKLKSEGHDVEIKKN
jgi:MFS superfamily sulfate permease-like transporter